MTTVQECVLCGKEALPRNLLTGDGFYENVYFHLHCLNTEAAMAWRRDREQAEPLYQRYHELITMGRLVACPACHFPMNLSPKARGMAAGSWEVCCTECHRMNLGGISWYDEKTRPCFDALGGLEHNFLHGIAFEIIAPEVERLAAIYDKTIEGRKSCRCGGRFSLDAKPRCARCRAVLFDSYFHWAWTEARFPTKSRVRSNETMSEADAKQGNLEL